jgi:hypothetical protein
VGRGGGDEPARPGARPQGTHPTPPGPLWGVARLASALTSGKASIVDYDILEKGCQKSSKALQMARKVKRNTMKLRKSHKTKLIL